MVRSTGFLLRVLHEAVGSGQRRTHSTIHMCQRQADTAARTSRVTWRSTVSWSCPGPPLLPLPPGLPSSPADALGTVTHAATAAFASARTAKACAFRAPSQTPFASTTASGAHLYVQQ